MTNFIVDEWFKSVDIEDIGKKQSLKNWLIANDYQRIFNW